MRALAGALLAGLVLLASGCGTGGVAKSGNANNGKKLFTGVGKCGGCHTLKDAGSKGEVGPNLDDAFMRPKEEGFKQSTIQNVVLDQIRFPTTGSGMPRNLVKGQDAKDVAAYVARCAAADPKKDKTACPGLALGSGGMGLYVSLGCQGCHSLDGSASSGPTFKGLYDSMVKLTNGKTVKADDAYLLESILDPDKTIVTGFQPGVMSAVIKKGQVSETDAKTLVDFLKKQK
ncbi:MAG: c-type cytochrome [Actinomycetota bacterium]